jgi:hypothetical protein
MKVLTRSLVALPLLAIALGADAPMYAGTIVEGQVGANLASVVSHLYDTGAQVGSAVSDNLPSWSFTCSTCVGYGISGNGAATVNNGSVGASAYLTVTGTPGAPSYVLADSSAVFTDMLTITNGPIGTSGVLELTYALDGVISHTGTGPVSSSVNLYTLATSYNFDNTGIQSIGNVVIGNDGTYNDTVTYYYPFTYGTAFATELYLDAGAQLVPGDSTPYSATVNYYNTAALNSALVFGGTISGLGAENNAANIGSASGLNYGPNGNSAVPEPSTWLLVASAMGVLALAKRWGDTFENRGASRKRPWRACSVGVPWILMKLYAK